MRRLVLEPVLRRYQADVALGRVECVATIGVLDDCIVHLLRNRYGLVGCSPAAANVLLMVMMMMRRRRRRWLVMVHAAQMMIVRCAHYVRLVFGCIDFIAADCHVGGGWAGGGAEVSLGRGMCRAIGCGRDRNNLRNRHVNTYQFAVNKGHLRDIAHAGREAQSLAPRTAGHASVPAAAAAT